MDAAPRAEEVEQATAAAVAAGRQIPGDLDRPDRAVVETQAGHDHIVDIQVGQDDPRAAGEDGGDLPPGHEAERVEVVDAQEVADGGARAVLAAVDDRRLPPGVGVDQLADVAACDGVPRQDEDRIEAQGVADHQVDAGLARQSHDLAALLEGAGQWLLDQDVLAPARGRLGRRQMLVLGRRDDDCIQSGLVEQLVAVRVGGGAQGAGDGLRPARVQVGHADQPGLRQLGHHPGEHGAHQSHANDPNACLIHGCDLLVEATSGCWSGRFAGPWTIRRV